MKNEPMKLSPFMLKLIFGTTDHEKIVELMKSKENQPGRNPYYFATTRGIAEVSKRSEQFKRIEHVLSVAANKNATPQQVHELQSELYNLREDFPRSEEFNNLLDKVEQALKSHSAFDYI
jgi:hypothetical protein